MSMSVGAHEPIRRRTAIVTGGAGQLAGFLRPRGPEGWNLVFTDIDASDDANIAPLDITDLSALVKAFAGADAVVHLAGLARHGAWSELSRLNVDGTYNVLEAARLAHVRRVVYASSNHAVGFHRRRDRPLPATIPARPDSLYGASKVAAESLCSVFADTHGSDIVCLRIGSCTPQPTTKRELATWLSPADFLRLVQASLDAPRGRLRIVWGVSANRETWWSGIEGAELGFVPRDDAAAVATGTLRRNAADAPDYVGGRAPLAVTD